MSDSGHAVDTSRTHEIGLSPPRTVLVGLGSLVFVALGAAMAFGYLDAGPAGVVIGWVCVAFFGLCAAAWSYGLLARRGPVVTISPAGLRDVRLAPETVPWSAIRGLREFTVQSQAFLLVDVGREAENALSLRRVPRFMRGANAAIGADGLAVSASNLAVPAQRLFEIAAAFWQRYRDASAPTGEPE